MKSIPIDNYKNYMITENGDVYNTLSSRRTKLKKPRKLKSFINKNSGYKQVVLRNNYKAKAFYVHRLVCLTYIPIEVNKPYVNHKDCNKLNNSLNNLEWCNLKENSQHYISIKGRPTPVTDRIINNKKLYKLGISLRYSGSTLDSISKLWNCSIDTARKILINQ